MLQELSDFLYPSKALRITLVNANKILYEYDTLNGEIINRAEALSSSGLERTYKTYRERYLRVEIDSNRLDRTWFVADTHFSHENTIYSARPFVGVAEMDEYIKNRWNELISSSVRVYVVGDFAKRNFINYMSSLKEKNIHTEQS